MGGSSPPGTDTVDAEEARRVSKPPSEPGGPRAPSAARRYYNILSVNFHAQSEHTFRGKRYPLELHLVRGHAH